MNILLSVVVPLFNNARYITRCVESIIAQDFRDDQPIEIIIVNDGSTDNAIEVVESLQGKYDSIRLINQENKGVSAARNRGIEEASGKYIYFIDSDDYLVPGYVSTFVDYLSSLHFKILCFGYKEVTQSDINDDIFAQNGHNTNYNISTIEDFDLYHHFGLFRYIFEREFILNTKIRFKEDIIIAEDLIWLNSILSTYKGKIIDVESPVYLYFQHSESIMHAKDSNRLKRISYNYFFVVREYIELLSAYHIDDIFSKYLTTIEIPRYVQLYLNAYYTGLIFKPFKEFVLDIKFLKSQLLYPLSYKTNSNRAKFVKYIINHQIYLFVVSLFRTLFRKFKK